MREDKILEIFYYISKNSRGNNSCTIERAMRYLYFADRFHVLKYGTLISGDCYFVKSTGAFAVNSELILREALKNGSEAIEVVGYNIFGPTSENFKIKYLKKSEIEALDFAIKSLKKIMNKELLKLVKEFPEYKRYAGALKNRGASRFPLILEDFFSKFQSKKHNFYSQISNKQKKAAKKKFLGESKEGANSSTPKT